jgi:hypothetical protein
MQQENATSSHAAGDDLDLKRAAVVEEAPDLVASLVHVSNDDQLPPSPTTSLRTASAPSQQVQLVEKQQYVVPHIDEQHHFQISQITKSLGLKTWAVPSTHYTQDSPAVDNARLTEPFSPDYHLPDFESEERSLVPIGKCKTLFEQKRSFE